MLLSLGRLIAIGLACLSLAYQNARAQALTPNDVFSWAEWKWPTLFPSGPNSASTDFAGTRYTFRSYQTGNYLGITASQRIDGLGPFTQNVITDLGTVDTFSRQIYEDRCLYMPAACYFPDRSQNIDRTKTQWLVFRATSPLDGTTTTRLVGSSLSGDFEIVCERGAFTGYYIKSNFVTANGGLSYRIGRSPIVTQQWRESSSNGYRALFPPTSDIELLRKLYQSNEFVIAANQFSSGSTILELRVAGFPAAIEQTRSDCGWRSDQFPPWNGWGSTSLPDIVPPNARHPTYIEGAGQSFSFAAWRATTPIGGTALLVRISEDKSRCKGGFLIGPKAFYVNQGGRQVEANPGFNLSLSCSSAKPITLALQGDFDPRQPLVLSAHPFHFSTLNPGEPFAALFIDDR